MYMHVCDEQYVISDIYKSPFAGNQTAAMGRRLDLKVVEWADFLELHSHNIKNILEINQGRRKTAVRGTANDVNWNLALIIAVGSAADSCILLLVRYCVS